MTDQVDSISPGKIDFDDNTQKRKSWACLGQTCSRSLIEFLSQLFVILLIIFEHYLWCEEFIIQTLVTNPLFRLEFCVVQQDRFYPNKDYEQVNF